MMAEIGDSALWNHVLRLQTFRPLLDFELDLLSLIQRLVAVALNGGEMDEHILARLALNKPKTFRSVEPLHGTLLFAHGIPLLSKEFALAKQRIQKARRRSRASTRARWNTSFLNAALCLHSSTFQSRNIPIALG